MNLEQRLERLERENRWMRRIGAVGVAVVAAVFLIGQGKDKELPDLEVRSLKVKDNAGKVRAVLASDTDGTVYLRLRDKDGKPRAGLTLFADSPSLDLWDKNCETRAVLGVTTTVDKVTGAETKTAESTLTLYDAQGTVVWQAPR
jgi:hypothetical protein